MNMSSFIETIVDRSPIYLQNNFFFYGLIACIQEICKKYHKYPNRFNNALILLNTIG